AAGSKSRKITIPEAPGHAASSGQDHGSCAELNTFLLACPSGECGLSVAADWIPAYERTLDEEVSRCRHHCRCTDPGAYGQSPRAPPPPPDARGARHNSQAPR